MFYQKFSNKKIIEFILQMENIFPVEEWTIDNIKIWPIIRNSLPQEIISQQTKIRQARTQQAIKSGGQAGIRSGLSFLDQIVTLLIQSGLAIMLVLQFCFKKSQVYSNLLIGDGVSKIKLQEVWWDKFCDPLKQTFLDQEKKTLMLEQITSDKKPSVSNFTSLAPLARLAYLISRVASHLHRFTHHFPSYELFQNELKKNGLAHVYSIKQLEMLVIQIKIHAAFYAFLIKKFQIQTALIVAYYSIPGYGLALACRQQGIECIEIEHGSVSNCPAYVAWSKMPGGGYELLPKTFHLWSNLVLDEMKQHNSPEFLQQHNLLVAGIPFLKYWQEKKIFDRRLQNSILKELTKGANPKTILVTLQPQFYGFEDWNKLATLIENSQKNYIWWVRLHPCYRNLLKMERILTLTQANVFYDDGTVPLYALMEIADCHITTASASSLEAMEFNIPTIFISEVGSEDFQSLIKNGHAFYESTEEGIGSRLHSLAYRRENL